MGIERERHLFERKIRRSIEYAKLKAWYQSKGNNKALKLLDQTLEVVIEAQYVPEDTSICIGNENLTAETVAVRLLNLRWYSLGAAIQKFLREKETPSKEHMRDELFLMVGHLQSYRFNQRHYNEIMEKSKFSQKANRERKR